MNLKVIIIGAGNVGTNLALAFFNNGIKVEQIISRNIKNAKMLAKKTNAGFSDNFEKLKEADLYFICTPDRIIDEICDIKNIHDKFIAHTAGSININILHKCSKHYGVFYPLQTFNKFDLVDFSNIPICIEASDSETQSILLNIGNIISKKIYLINSEQRLKLHVAAVFTNNFVNHIMALTNNFIEEEIINKDILEPLLIKTFENILTKNPNKIQTGPAKRNDQVTIQKHINTLKKHLELQNLYSCITNSITNTYQKNT
ncbi:MAG: DUF2520 domain-containing protein [Bacteroidales bacterium]|nr:DUF2520 domain-containing protein [Bacteroidales bacterium]